MKSVMISIKPYWVFLIIAKTMGWNIDKEKTVGVRKTCPKDDDWNKIVKIYCTKDRESFDKIPKEYQPFMEKFLGKVIGEFVCDYIEDIVAVEPFVFGGARDYFMLQPNTNKNIIANAYLSFEEVDKYLDGSDGYGWHISDIKVYDKPKELNEFHIEDKTKILKCEHRFRAGKSEFITAQGGWKNRRRNNICMKSGKPEWCENCFTKPLTQVPQSWCYCKEAIS